MVEELAELQVELLPRYVAQVWDADDVVKLQQRIVGVTKRLGLEQVERGAPGRDERCVL